MRVDLALGPIGRDVFFRLVEFCTEEGGPLIVLRNEWSVAERQLAIPPEWAVDLRGVLTFLTKRDLVVTSRARKATSFQPKNIDRYLGPQSERSEYKALKQREYRKRHQVGSGPRGGGVTVTGTQRSRIEEEVETEVEVDKDLLLHDDDEKANFAVVYCLERYSRQDVLDAVGIVRPRYRSGDIKTSIVAYLEAVTQDVARKRGSQESRSRQEDCPNAANHEAAGLIWDDDAQHLAPCPDCHVPRLEVVS